MVLQKNQQRIMESSEWIPLVQHIEPFSQHNTDTTEPFVSGSQTTSIVTTIMTVASCMIVAALTAMLFYWSYQKDVAIFIALLCGIAFAYALMNIIYTSVKSKDYDPMSFRIYLGAGVIVASMNLIMLIYFAVQSARRNRYTSSLSSSSSSSMNGFTD